MFQRGGGGRRGNVSTGLNVFRQVQIPTGLDRSERIETCSNRFKRVSTGCTNMDTPRMFVDVSLKIFFVKNLFSLKTIQKKDTVKANELFIEL